jgi:hypothetical protein
MKDMTPLANNDEARRKDRERYAESLRAIPQGTLAKMPTVLYGRIVGPPGTPITTLTLQLPLPVLNWLEDYAARLKSDAEAVSFHLLMWAIEEAKKKAAGSGTGPMSENDNPDTMNSEHWLTQLTQPELAHWEAKPQSQKDWWYANTKPDDRGGILRTEIKAAANYTEFLHLPEPTRDAITRRLEKEADAARIRLRQLGFGSPEQAPKANDENPHA